MIHQQGGITLVWKSFKALSICAEHVHLITLTSLQRTFLYDIRILCHRSSGLLLFLFHYNAAFTQHSDFSATSENVTTASICT